MSILDKIELTQEREDGKVYTTTASRMEEDAKIQAELLKQERKEKEEKRLKRQRRKEKWVAWWKTWGPVIWEVVKIIGIIVALGVLLYFLFWIALIGIGLAAVGGGMAEGGSEHQQRANYYNQLNRDRPSNNPKHWRK